MPRPSATVYRIDAALALLGESAPGTLSASVRRKVNALLATNKKTNGNEYVRDFGMGLAAAVEALSANGIELGHTVSPPMGKSGRVTADIAFTNTADSFSPVAISNSQLLLTWEKMATGVEIVAYLT